MFRSVLCGAVAMSLVSLTSAQEVNLASNEKATEQVIAALILTDIYKNAGLTVKIQPLPGARANAVTLSGEKDGEVARVQAYANKNATLITVEPAYFQLAAQQQERCGHQGGGHHLVPQGFWSTCQVGQAA